MERGAIEGKLKVLEQYGFFREVPPALKTEILGAAKEVQLPAGTVVFDRGGSCSAIALIGFGSIRVFIGSETGREITLYHVGPGETCPINLLSSILGKPVPATGIVEEVVHAVLLPVGPFRQWMLANESVRSFMIEGLAGRFVDIFQQVNEITFGKLDQRLADFLARGFAASEDRPAVIVTTHEKIAAELSTVREVVSRLLREFERMGAVDLGRGRITLRDEALLGAQRY